VPNKVPMEKKLLLRIAGAELDVISDELCPAPGLGEGSINLAKTHAKASRHKYAMPNQYENEKNVEAHFRTTGPEIWRQTEGRVTHFVAGVGTGGTITGVARYLKAQNPRVQIVAADPEGSVYSGGTGRPYLVEGVGEDFWPTTYDPTLVDRTVMVSDAESFAAARRVTCEEGLLIGGSCGTAIHAALVVGEEVGPDAVVVVLLPDSGRNYLSKIFDDQWMIDFGFLRCGDGPCAGDVLAAKDRRIADLVLITPDQPARRAIGMMRDLGISQLVVSVTTEQPLAAKEVSGVLNELDLMDRAFGDASVLDRPVKEIMSPAMPMIGTGEPVSALVAQLDRAASVLVLDGGHPVGVLTRSDVLSFLASRSPG
jgi:cystathionine beta-synthase